jgi:hypothetical protein
VSSHENPYDNFVKKVLPHDRRPGASQFLYIQSGGGQSEQRRDAPLAVLPQSKTLARILTVHGKREAFWSAPVPWRSKQGALPEPIACF